MLAGVNDARQNIDFLLQLHVNALALGSFVLGLAVPLLVDQSPDSCKVCSDFTVYTRQAGI